MEKQLNNYEILVHYYASSIVVIADYRTPHLTSKQQLVNSLRPRFLLICRKRIHRQIWQRSALKWSILSHDPYHTDPPLWNKFRISGSVESAEL